MFSSTFYIIIILTIVNLIIYIQYASNSIRKQSLSKLIEPKKEPQHSLNSSNQTLIIKDKLFSLSKEIKSSKVIFVCGNPGSGTTLMRIILDVSPRINCGGENPVMPLTVGHVKGYRSYISKLDNWKHRVDIFQRMNEALSLFVIYFLGINQKSSEVDIFCTKDPEIGVHMDYFHILFPNAKFVYMLRDGRGSALSSMKRMDQSLTSDVFYKWMKKWNNSTSKAFKDCTKLGKETCQFFKYEDLVTKPEETIRSVLKFINVEYNQDFLHHEKFVNTGEIDFSFKSKTGKEINTDMLKSWRGVIEYDKKYVANAFPMMKQFGYEIDFDDEIDGKMISKDLKPIG